MQQICVDLWNWLLLIKEYSHMLSGMSRDIQIKVEDSNEGNKF